MPVASTFDRIVPLPRTLQLITVATFLMSLADFIIGMLDLGTAGFFLNVAAAGFTMVHDSTVVWYARRIYPNEKPTFFPPAASPLNIMFLGACVFTYTVACGMLVWTSTAVFDADGTVNWGTPAGAGTVITQVILSGTCAAVLAYEALWCLRSRSEGRQYGYGHLF
ncbi:hypothetical protein PENSPDRAFT_687077 [Peniophora sp. CONT]|nr:hypothetical protein PENSPDRAFT_687077 [Peniophora sp. CONT]